MLKISWFNSMKSCLIISGLCLIPVFTPLSVLIWCISDRKLNKRKRNKLTLNLEEPKMIVLLQGQIFIIIFIIITLYRKHQRRTRRAHTLLFCPPVVSLHMTASHEKDARETDYCFIQTRATVWVIHGLFYDKNVRLDNFIRQKSYSEKEKSE